MTTEQKLLSHTIIKAAGYFLRKDCSSLFVSLYGGAKNQTIKTENCSYVSSHY